MVIPEHPSTKDRAPNWVLFAETDRPILLICFLCEMSTIKQTKEADQCKSCHFRGKLCIISEVEMKIEKLRDAR